MALVLSTSDKFLPCLLFAVQLRPYGLPRMKADLRHEGPSTPNGRSPNMPIIVTFPCITKIEVIGTPYKNSSGDEIANVNFYAVRPEATRIR